MNNRRVLREIRKIDKQLLGLQLEGALLEVMKNEVLLNLMLHEERKIVKYALRIGIMDKRQLNEGAMDWIIGIGQAVGSIPGLSMAGVGAAFGAAGVLWYGYQMMNSSGFEFAMNTFMCLMSAVAIDPSGVFGEGGVVGKLLKPILDKVGPWALKAVGMSPKALETATASLGVVEQGVITTAAKAEGPITKGMNFISSKILPNVEKIFESIKGSISSLPGAEHFQKIVDFMLKHKDSAFKEIEKVVKSIIAAGKKLLGMTDGGGDLKQIASKAAPQISQVNQKLIASTQAATSAASNAAGNFNSKMFGHAAFEGHRIK